MKYWLFNVIAGKGINRSLVVETLRRFYGKWMHLSNNINPYSYNIIIEECNRHEIRDVNIVRTCIERMNIYSIRQSIEYGRALLRHNISWNGQTYILDISKGEQLADLDIHPAYDLFIWSKETWILKNIGLKYGENPLLHKRFGGEHYIYSGDIPIAKLIIGDEDLNIHGIQMRDRTFNNNIELFIEYNKDILSKHLSITRHFLESLGEPDIVIVSFSGGKDSLVTLDLAVKHYGSEMVKGIYVDTGVDFPITSRYIDNVSERLNVEIYRVYAPVKENISRYGLPTRRNRWCTLLKTAAFKKKIREITDRYRRVLVIVGDRDVESEARARKPPVRRRRGYLEAAPLKQWPTILVQLYVWANRLEINPLYNLGFYRLGCYICPALTSLEKYVMVEKLREELEDKEWFNEFVKREIGGIIRGERKEDRYSYSRNTRYR